MYKLMYFAKKISYIPKPFYFYTQENENSYTKTKMNPAKQANNILLIQQMDEFRKQHSPMSEDLTKAFLYKKAGTYAAIALYGNYNELKSNNQLFKETSIKLIKGHPFIGKPVKLAGILYKSHCIILLKCLRLAQKLKHLCNA